MIFEPACLTLVDSKTDQRVVIRPGDQLFLPELQKLGRVTEITETSVTADLSGELGWGGGEGLLACYHLTKLQEYVDQGAFVLRYGGQYAIWGGLRFRLYQTRRDVVEGRAPVSGGKPNQTSFSLPTNIVDRLREIGEMVLEPDLTTSAKSE